MFTNKFITLALAAAAVAFVGSGASANLIINGDFQALAGPGYDPLGVNDPLAPSTTTYARGNPDMYPEATWNVVSHDTLHGSWVDYYDHTYGDERGLYMIVNGREGEPGNSWRQIVEVEPNTDYDLSGWFSSLYPDAVASLQFKLFDVPNETYIATDSFSAPAELATWVQHSFAFNSGNSSTLAIEIWDTNEQHTGNDYSIDDLTLEARSVPEPTSLATIAPAALLLTRRRRTA